MLDQFFFYSKDCIKVKRNSLSGRKISKLKSLLNPEISYDSMTNWQVTKVLYSQL